MLLLTGATGKVGRHFLNRLLAEPTFDAWPVRAVGHRRAPEFGSRVEGVQGSLADRDFVRQIAADVTHVVHLATCKETPDEVIDVTVKGLFWLLEELRSSPHFVRFVLVGGDAAVGHFHYAHPIPVTETQGHTAYPGCYALSKVLEEVTLEQYRIQYGLDGVCLRAPWIMEKDDFRYQLSFGDDVFGAPRWRELVGAELADRYVREKAVPLPLDAEGRPLLRNFVHVDDLASALLIALDHPAARAQTMNVCTDEPIDYGKLAAYLEETRGMTLVEIETPWRSTWLDNAKAKFLLGWRPAYDYRRMADEAFDYVRSPDDPRMIWYPG